MAVCVLQTMGGSFSFLGTAVSPLVTAPINTATSVMATGKIPYLCLFVGCHWMVLGHKMMLGVVEYHWMLLGVVTCHLMLLGVV